MDKVSVLCSRDSRILHDFSRLSLEELKDRSFLFMPLPFLRAYLNANVSKEIDKDHLIIEYAAARFKEGRPCSEQDIEKLFELTKQVDSTFLRRTAIPSLSIAVRYEDIAPIRKSRIVSLSRCVHDLLARWEVGFTLEEAVRSAYRKREFQNMIAGMLHLYSQETRQLSRSIRVFGPFRTAAGAFASSLYSSMEKTAEELASVVADTVYGRKGTGV